MPGRSSKNPTLRGILASRTKAGLNEATRHRHYNLGASSDDQPFFFNMLKLSAWREVAKHAESSGIIAGNLRASQTLVSLLLIVSILVVLTILLPLLLRGRGHGLAGSAAMLITSMLYNP